VKNVIRCDGEIDARTADRVTDGMDELNGSYRKHFVPKTPRAGLSYGCVNLRTKLATTATKSAIHNIVGPILSS